MNFRLHQKVVCVGPADDIDEWSDCESPRKGAVCTIVGFETSDEGELHLVLAEWPTPDDDGFCPGWLASCFRPAVERKTDISVLTAMLRPEPNKGVRTPKKSKERV
jgi:hypothetical protein